MRPVRLNVGCGATPTSGWINLDNSISVRLANLPLASSLVSRYGSRVDFIRTARSKNIRWANAVKHIPLEAESVDVLYSSHMIEHLDHREARHFLREACRVLVSGGIIRIGVPDISKLVAQYIQSGDADEFIESTLLTVAKPRNLAQKIRYLLVGPRHHHWMYDGQSMLKFLTTEGFVDAEIVAPGQTRISNPGALDLWERHEVTVYVEASKPQGLLT